MRIKGEYQLDNGADNLRKALLKSRNDQKEDWVLLYNACKSGGDVHFEGQWDQLDKDLISSRKRQDEFTWIHLPQTNVIAHSQ